MTPETHQSRTERKTVYIHESQEGVLQGLRTRLNRWAMAVAAAGILAGCVGNHSQKPLQDSASQSNSPDASGDDDIDSKFGKKVGALTATPEGWGNFQTPEKGWDTEDAENQTGICVVDGQMVVVFTQNLVDGSSVLGYSTTPLSSPETYNESEPKIISGLESLGILESSVACFEDKVFFEPLIGGLNMATLAFDGAKLMATDLIDLGFGASKLGVVDGYLHFSLGGKVPIDELPSQENGAPSEFPGDCGYPQEVIPGEMWLGLKEVPIGGGKTECRVYTAKTAEGILSSPFTVNEFGKGDFAGLSVLQIPDGEGGIAQVFITFAKRTYAGGKMKLYSSSISPTPLATPDTLAPNAVIDLGASEETQTSVMLGWTAPGDDGAEGTATSYDIRYSTSPITESNWSSADQATGEPSPAVAGTSQYLTVGGLPAGTECFFAMKATDDNGNKSPISNVASAWTISLPADPGPDEADVSEPTPDVPETTDDGQNTPDEGAEISETTDDGGANDAETNDGDTGVLPDSIPPKDVETEVEDPDVGPDPDATTTPDTNTPTPDTTTEPDTVSQPNYKPFKITLGDCTFTVTPKNIGSVTLDRVDIMGSGICEAEIMVEGYAEAATLTLTHSEGGAIKAHCDFPDDPNNPKDKPTCQEDTSNIGLGLVEEGQGVIIEGDGFALVATGSEHRFEYLEDQGEGRLARITNETAGSGLILRFTDTGAIVPIPDAGSFVLNVDQKTLKPETVDTVPTPQPKPKVEESGGCNITMNTSNKPSSVPTSALLGLVLLLTARLRGRSWKNRQT